MKTHECFDEIDEKLSKSNTRLLRNVLNSNHVFIETTRIDNRRKRATVVIASYCPFCGEKLEGV